MEVSLEADYNQGPGHFFIPLYIHTSKDGEKNYPTCRMWASSQGQVIIISWLPNLQSYYRQAIPDRVYGGGGRGGCSIGRHYSGLLWCNFFLDCFHALVHDIHLCLVLYTCCRQSWDTHSLRFMNLIAKPLACHCEEQKMTGRKMCAVSAEGAAEKEMITVFDDDMGSTIPAPCGY